MALDILMNLLANLTVGAVMLVAPDVRSDLQNEIREWKPGQEIPHRLLSYPDGKVDEFDPNICGLAVYFDSVRALIGQIEDEKLLEEIIFDRRSAPASFQAAVTALVQMKGLRWFAEMLARRDSTRWEHEAFQQMLQSTFAKTSVAFIKSGAMHGTQAKEALEELKNRLDAGEPWLPAYLAVADSYPDVERRKITPQVSSTLVGYWYDGWASEFGFDFSNLNINPNVPAKLFRKAINAGKGGTIVAEKEGTYLLYVFDIVTPNA